MKDATPLTDLKVRKAQPKDEPYRLHDGNGLALLIQPTGVKSWQFRYRLNGKAQTLTIGKLDQITLADARDKAEIARKRVANGEHLTAVKREAKAKNKADRENTLTLLAEHAIRIRELESTSGYKFRPAPSLAHASRQRYLRTIHPRCREPACALRRT